MTNTQEQTANQIATKAVASDAMTSLVTMDTKKYVTQVYAPFETDLKAAIKKFKSTKAIDVTTKDGMENAKELRRLFKGIRIAADNERKAQKAPILEIGKQIEERNNEFKAKIDPYETEVDNKIKAEEKRIEDEKLAKLEAEEKRISALNEKVSAIEKAPLEAINETSAQVRARIADLSIIVPTQELYEERYVEVEVMLEQTIASLTQIAEGKEAQEAQAKASEEANAERAKQEVETNRVSAIKARIASIKEYLFTGMQCDNLEDLRALTTKVSALAINETYEEFLAEAQTAKSAVLDTLTKTVEKMEKEEVAKPTVSNTQAETAVADIVKAKVNHSEQEVAPLSANPPTVAQIVKVVADGFAISEKDALELLQEVDFYGN